MSIRKTSILLASFFAALAKCKSEGERSFGITTDPDAFSKQSYDYLIVGGGNAGLVLANRLSENPDYTVGVIEAGLYRPDEPLINVPYLFGQSVGNKTLDWAFETTPQPGLFNRTLAQPRGKVLGGSSALTYHNYNRGSAQEYDAWAEIGNPGWDWRGIYPYFTKADTVTPGDPGFLPDVTARPGEFNAADGATSGPIKVSYSNNASFITQTVRLFHEAFIKLGAWSNPDPEGGNATGITLTARSIDPEKGVRSYATNGYLEPVLERKNLYVLTGAEATKILFNNANATTGLVANGVQYGTDGNLYSAHADKEVILSAGALKSPQLLELSGIGNRTLLEGFGIEVLLDLPEVGENLQDHLEFNTDYLLKADQPYETWDVFRNNATRNEEALALYEKTGSGIYSASPPTLDFFPLQAFPDAFDMEELVSTLDKEIASTTLTPIRKKQFEIQRRQLLEGKTTQVELAFVPRGGIANSPIPVEEGRSYFTMVLFVLHPYSTGNVHIASADPFAAPLIDPRYNEFTFDWQVAANLTRLSRRIFEQEPLASLVERPLQPPASTETLEDWDAFCRNYTISVWHPVGSTSMAPRDIGGVVDNKLIVYGTKNVRVVDAGSFPINVAAHTAASVYAFAEKGADIIKADRRNLWNDE